MSQVETRVRTTPTRTAPGTAPATTERAVLDRSWIWVPLGIFLASRVVSTALLLLAGPGQGPPPGLTTGPDGTPSLAELLMNWDGVWYHQIATYGYPLDLPRVDGAVVENPWAFYPLAPALARMVMLTGADFVWAASVVSLVTSAAACVLLFDMLRERTGSFTAAMTVAGLTFGPIGLALQTPYTEGPALLLVLLALRALGARRWGRLVAYGVLLAFTRPVTLALAAVCGVTWCVLWWRRDREPFPVGDRVRLAGATAVIAAGFAAWPTVAGIATGEGDAYRLTQAAWLYDEPHWTTWLSGFVGRGPWQVTMAGVLALALVGRVAFRREAARAWPLAGRLWTVLYVLYVLGATRPTTSVLRYLVLAAFPMWPLPELSQRCASTRARIALAVPVLLACCAAQWWWTANVWVMHGEHSHTP